MFWHNRLTRGPAGLRSLLAAVVLGLLFLSGGAAPASAGTDQFCTNKWVVYNEICTGPTHTLTGSRGLNQGSGVGCGGEAYGAYTCAIPAGCLAYNGAALRTPAIRHRASTQRLMSGNSTWGSTAPPPNCVGGSNYRTVGPVTSAEPVGVPVLEDRETETAPASLAELWPNADPERARHFSTPTGDGWVLTRPADRQVCVAVSIPDTGYGYTCQSYNQARLQGALLTIEDSDVSTAKGDMVVALPAEDSAGLEVTRKDGSVRTVPEVDGVAVAMLGAKDDGLALLPSDDAAGVKAQGFSVGAKP